MTEECEFNPDTSQAALEGQGCRNQSWWSIGSGMWHVCDSCSMHPYFSNYQRARALNANPAMKLDLLARREAEKDWTARRKHATEQLNKGEFEDGRKAGKQRNRRNRDR